MSDPQLIAAIIGVITAIIGIFGSFAISYYTVQAGRRKNDAEINEIYNRLGITREKGEAEAANTWMDVAKKAADEYQRVMNENSSLRSKVDDLEGKYQDVLDENSALRKRIQGLQSRIVKLEGKKRAAK